MKYYYTVTFYSPDDDGSHPYGNWELKFKDADEAFAYAETEVNRMWRNQRAGASDKDWFDKHVEKEIFVVEVKKIK